MRAVGTSDVRTKRYFCGTSSLILRNAGCSASAGNGWTGAHCTRFPFPASPQLHCPPARAIWHLIPLPSRGSPASPCAPATRSSRATRWEKRRSRATRLATRRSRAPPRATLHFSILSNPARAYLPIPLPSLRSRSDLASTRPTRRDLTATGPRAVSIGIEARAVEVLGIEERDLERGG